MCECVCACVQDDALKMRSRLREEFRVEVPLCYSGHSMLHVDSFNVVAYARISHQVYNKLEDYYTLRDAVNSILAQGDYQDSVSSTKCDGQKSNDGQNNGSVAL